MLPPFDSLPYFSVQTCLGMTITVTTVVWFCFITALLFKIIIIFLKEGNNLLLIDWRPGTRKSCTGKIPRPGW